MTTACVIIIGNEILSGRTQDINLNWLAKSLNDIGVRLKEARVVPDSEAAIVGAVNGCRKLYDYVFITGGIGPTHDDITTACVASAFGVKVLRDGEAERRLRAHYTADMINEARLRMADIPEGATLIDNPVSAAPGYIMENVYVMAGVPKIMQAMFDGIRHQLQGGIPLISHTLSAYVTEGSIADELTKIQRRYPEVDIGSYPFIRNQKLGVSIVLRAEPSPALEIATQEVGVLLAKFSDVMEEA